MKNIAIQSPKYYASLTNLKFKVYIDGQCLYCFGTCQLRTTDGSHVRFSKLVFVLIIMVGTTGGAAGMQSHRPGSLKQANKSHKGGRHRARTLSDKGTHVPT